MRKQLPRGPFDGVFFKLFGLGNEYWTFFPYREMAYLKSENILFADGTENQKCTSIFFILCGYIDHVYVFMDGVGRGIKSVL